MITRESETLGRGRKWIKSGQGWWCSSNLWTGHIKDSWLPYLMVSPSCKNTIHHVRRAQREEAYGKERGRAARRQVGKEGGRKLGLRVQIQLQTWIGHWGLSLHSQILNSQLRPVHDGIDALIPRFQAFTSPSALLVNIHTPLTLLLRHNMGHVTSQRFFLFVFFFPPAQCPV